MWCADRIIEPLEKKRDAEATSQTEHERHHQGATQVGRGRPAGHHGPIDDKDVVGPDTAGDIDFLVPLQKPLVERPYGVGFPSQVVVLDAAPLQIQRFHPQRLDAGAHLVLLLDHLLIGCLVRVLDRFDLDRNLTVDFLHPTHQLEHGWITGLEGFELVLVFGVESAASGPKLLNDRIHQELREIYRVGQVELSPKLLDLDALGDDTAQRGVRGRQVGFGSRCLVARDNELLLLGESNDRFLCLLEPELQLRQLILEKRLSVDIGLEALVDIGRNDGIAIGIGDKLRTRWRRVRVADVDEAGTRNNTHRLMARYNPPSYLFENSPIGHGALFSRSPAEERLQGADN